MRVVIGEDEVLLREGLALVATRAGFEVVGMAADADELLTAARTHHPDLVVTDIRMPPQLADDGLRAAQRIRSERPGTAVLILSQHVNREYALELLEGGTSGVGYLLKQRIADVATFCDDLRRLGAGGSVIDPELVAAMLAHRRHGDPVEQLTPRQRQVLSLMAEGRSNGAIADTLVLSEKAVVKHVSHIYDQLGLPASPEDHRRVLAVVRYLSGLQATTDPAHPWGDG